MMQKYKRNRTSANKFCERPVFFNETDDVYIFF